MVGLAIVCSGMLAFAAPDPPEADEPVQAVPTIQGQLEKDRPKAVEKDPPKAVEKDPPKAVENDTSQALAEYNTLREKTPETAAAHWKLGVWCEQHGLTAESYAHFATVVRLDPTREAAWRKLGFKKHGKRWMSDAEIADEAEQKKADKVWSPQLKKWHKDIHGGKKQHEAQEALSAVKDPRAVPAIYREFAGGGAKDHLILVQTLAKFDTPLASKLLALSAIYGKSPEVRRIATENLRSRNPNEFLEVLVALLADPVKYEVRPVGGPGSPGVLFVEGKKFNTRLIYSAPAPPVIAFQPGDRVSYDAFGMPVIDRPNGLFSISTPIPLPKDAKPGTPQLVFNQESTTRFSLAEGILESQRAAVTSQAQLANDVAALDSLNKAKNRFNELVITAARDATGKDHGDKPDNWRNAIAARQAYQKRETKKPTYDDFVPLAYDPVFGRLNMVDYLTAKVNDG